MKQLITPLIFTIIFTFISVQGCGGSGADIQNYQDPALSKYDIKTIAVLPIRNSYLNLNESKDINRYFMTGVSRKIAKFTVISPDDAIESLNRDTLVEQYYNYLVAYSTTGIPNRELVKKLGKSIGCDAVIQGEIYNITKKDGEYGKNKGETRCSVRYSMVSTTDGKVIWETSADAYEKTDLTFSGAPALMDVVKVGVDEIITSMPNFK